MNAKFAGRLLGLVSVGIGLAALSGCQTNVAGMTLPSGHYLQHPPQYFAQSPAFPLQRELAAMEAQIGGQAGAVAPPPGGVVPPVAPLAPQLLPGGGLIPSQQPP